MSLLSIGSVSQINREHLLAIIHIGSLRCEVGRLSLALAVEVRNLNLLDNSGAINSITEGVEDEKGADLHRLRLVSVALAIPVSDFLNGEVSHGGGLVGVEGVEHIESGLVLLEGHSIIEVNEAHCSSIDIRSISSADLGVGGVGNHVEVHPLVELVLRVLGVVDRLVLHGHDVPVAEVHVVVFHLRSQCDVAVLKSAITSDAVLHVLQVRQDLAPLAFREIEVSLSVRQPSGLDRSLEGGSEHNVPLDVVITVEVGGPLEEDGLEEAATELGDLPELRVVVTEDRVFVLDRSSDQVSVGSVLTIPHGGVESVGLLRSSSVLVVVPRPGEQGSQLVPPRAEVGGGISVETAEVATHEGEAEDLVLIDVLHGSDHVLNPRPVVADPVMGILLEAGRVRSRENVGSKALLVGEVIGGGLGLHQSEGVMHIELSPAVGVAAINSEGLALEISLARDVVRLVPEGVLGPLLGDTVAIAEVGGFVLIEPDSIELKAIAVLEVLPHGVPVLLSVGVVEVGEVGVSAPDTSGQWVVALSLLDEDLHLHSHVVGFKVCVLTDCNSSVHDGHESHVLLADLVHEIREALVARLRDGEELVVVHVINISPHSINRELEFLVLVDYILPVLISDPTEAALLPSEGPEGLHGRHTGQLGVLDDHIIGLGTSKEVLLDHATDHHSGDRSLISIVSRDDIVSGIRVIVENSEPVGVSILVHVERLNSVHVSARRNTIVNGVCCVVGPARVHGTVLVLEEEVTGPFSDSDQRVFVGLVHVEKCVIENKELG
mmetsp:Transcript_29346/g.44218  ORF Transcript_29346/g.44218 Transcript_29346/m.44218 type:complete len:776 (-) Transcript_29346:3477-5804(-)